MIELKKDQFLIKGFDAYRVNGIATSQKWGTYEAFEKLKEFKIERVIEVGTWMGGLALLLKKRFEVPVFTFDINPCDNAKVLTDNDIKFIHRDAFESPDMAGLIKNPGKVLVLCDGGHKKNELTFFGTMLKKGDLIGAHDYSKDGEAKYWVTSEIDGTMIDEFCENHNIREIMADVFHPVAWTIREKC